MGRSGGFEQAPRDKKGVNLWMSELSLAHAVEKVAFRLGLLNEGQVSLARMFIELPLCFDQVDQVITDIADGRALLKDESGEFCAAFFPELSAGDSPAPRDDCPVCGGEPPPLVTVGGEEAPRALVCDSCYRTIAHRARPTKSGALRRIKQFFTEEAPDPRVVARLEHDLVFHALAVGGQELTHTAIAAQTSHPMADIKERLHSMGARRYVRFGLTSGGDAVAYSFPPGLDYPESQYQRFLATYGLSSELRAARPAPRPPTRSLAIGVKSRPGRPSTRLVHQDSSSPSRALRIVVKRKDEEDGSSEPTSPPELDLVPESAEGMLSEPALPEQESPGPARPPEPSEADGDSLAGESFGTPIG